MQSDLWQEIREVMAELESVRQVADDMGRELVSAESQYYTAKAKAAFALKELGYPVTLIDTVLKGVDCELARKYGVTEVNAAMTRYHAAQVAYDNARDARNDLKKRLSILNDQYNREWHA